MSTDTRERVVRETHGDRTKSLTYRLAFLVCIDLIALRE